MSDHTEPSSVSQDSQQKSSQQILQQYKNKQQKLPYQKSSAENSSTNVNTNNSNIRLSPNVYPQSKGHYQKNHFNKGRNSNPIPNIQWNYGYNPSAYYSQFSPYGYPIAQIGSTPGFQPSVTASDINTSSSISKTPVAKKIEITNNSGEHVDLSALHTAQHSKSVECEDKNQAIKGKNDESDKKTKLDFLEEVKRRKALLAKRKAELELKPQEEAVAETKSDEQIEILHTEGQEISIGSEENIQNKHQDILENKDIDKPEVFTDITDKESIQSVPKTFAEKLRLKKAQQGLADEKVIEQQVKEIPVEDFSNAVSESCSVTVADPVSESLIDPILQSDTESASVMKKQVSEVDDREEEFTDALQLAEEEQEEEEIDDGRLTITELLAKLEVIQPVDDVYTFDYPEPIIRPAEKFKKLSIKYTYGPEFLYQFKDKVNTRPDLEWKKNISSKIVIPPGTGRSNNKLKVDRFGPGAAFKKSGSLRMEGRSNSRSSSKRKSKKAADDRRSNRSYTSRKERERIEEEAKIQEKNKEDVAPLVPSANRWLPKSRAKKQEKKFAPDGVTELLDKDEAERKMKSLLNKLTLEKFDTISDDIMKVASLSKWEDNGEILKITIEQIFHKACDEPHWSSMYAQLCGKVVKELDSEISDKDCEGKTGPMLVLHYLVDRCHTEFQKGWSDKLPTNEDGSALEPEMMSDEYYKAEAAKRRGLGLVRFIGFLYRSHLLTVKMMFECFRRLMRDLVDSPSEDTLESVVELLSTVGQQFENDQMCQNSKSLGGSIVLDQLFSMLDEVIKENKISSRIKFKLIDMKELREEKNWNHAKKDDGPKTIAQIHEEEAAKKMAEERERKLKNGSRSVSKRQSNSIGSKGSSRRELLSGSKDDFITTRSTSMRHVQTAPKEEVSTTSVSINMFDALMQHDDDDDE